MGGLGKPERALRAACLLPAALVLLTVGLAAGSALAQPDTAPARTLDESAALNIGAETMALLDAPTASAPAMAANAALPGPAEPPAMVDAVTADLPVWPWSAPLDEGGRDDPAQGYNIWTYGFALALIVLGLTLGRRAVSREPAAGSGARRPPLPLRPAGK